jgi:hypothetical protein
VLLIQPFLLFDPGLQLTYEWCDHIEMGALECFFAVGIYILLLFLQGGQIGKLIPGYLANLFPRPWFEMRVLGH